MDTSERLYLVGDRPRDENIGGEREAGSETGETALDLPGQHTTRRWVIGHQSHVWRPPTDVFEIGDHLVVMVEIAGMRDGEFNVVLQDRRLMISGVRRRVVREQIAYHQMEVRYGEFRTEVSLPWPVSRENVSATYKDGFLRVELAQAPNQQIHIVDV